MKIELRNQPLRLVRADHKVPGVVYGHGIEPTSVSIDDKVLRKALHDYGTSMTFEVELAGDKHLVYIKDMQTDPLHNYAPLHVDLMKVSTDDTITSSVSLNFQNREGLTQPGEVLSINLNEVTAEAKVGKGVAHIDVDLSLLKEADAFYIKDIVVPDGVTLLHDEDELVANITIVAQFDEDTTEEDEDIVITEEEPEEE